MSKLAWSMAFAALSLTGCNDQHLAATNPFTPTASDGITWNKDVLPIVQSACQGCHTDGGIAPFTLKTYADAKQYATMIKSEVENRLMPPWLPKAGCGEFVDDRHLNDDQIAIFTKWVETGSAEGDPADAPSVGTKQQGLASVDATLMPKSVYTPIGDPSDPKKLDDYHCFVVDPALTKDKYLVGFEVLPGVTREVHHVLLYPATKADVMKASNNQPDAGWTCFGGPGTGGSAILGGWVPGMVANKFPAGTGIQMKTDDLIVMQVHYNLLNGPPAPDRTTIKLDYADAPVAKPATMLPILDAKFVIPPKTTDHTDTVPLKVPVDVHIRGVLPHMHTLGKQISLKIDDACLIDIPKWDFHWQQSYYFTNPDGILVKAGQTATLSCTWSNPGSTEVRWGESTTDEMCLSYVYLTY